MSKKRIGGSLRRAARCALACILTASMTLSPITPAVEMAFAAQPNGSSAYVQTGREVRYGGGGRTNEFDVNGAIAGTAKGLSVLNSITTPIADTIALVVTWSRMRPKTMRVTMDVFGNRI